MTRAEQIEAVERCIDVAEHTAAHQGGMQKVNDARAFLEELKADTGRPVAWMTQESLDRLQKGGNNSRGSVPVHAKASGVASIPLYVHPPAHAQPKQCSDDKPAAWILKYGNSRTRILNGRYALSWYMDEIPLEGEDVPLIGIPLFTHAPAPALMPAIPEGWQPIETAPTDGTWVLLCGGEIDALYHWHHDTDPSVVAANFSGDRFKRWQFSWYDDGHLGEYKNPTHWRPLPEPPKENK